MENFLPILIVAAILIAIQIAIIRYVFRIDTQIKNQNKMINLLGHLLKVQGVSQEDVNILTGKK